MIKLEALGRVVDTLLREIALCETDPIRRTSCYIIRTAVIALTNPALLRAVLAALAREYEVSLGATWLAVDCHLFAVRLDSNSQQEKLESVQSGMRVMA